VSLVNVVALSSNQIIAIVGIGGTLAGTIVGAVVAPWVGGRSERRNRLLDRRIDAYADLLEVIGQIEENLEAWSATPMVDLPEPLTDRLRTIDAQIRVVGSDSVREMVSQISHLAFGFHDLRSAASSRAVGIEGDSAEAINRMRFAVNELADRIRKEMKVES
jgi:hypothetical protein